MTEFIKEKIYIFTGSDDLIERKKEESKEDKKEILGKFIKYIDIIYVGDIYDKAKAEFEYGFVNFPYYNKVEELK